MDFCIETEKAAEVGLCLDLFRPFYTFLPIVNANGVNFIICLPWLTYVEQGLYRNMNREVSEF